MELFAVALLGLAVGLCLSVPVYRRLERQYRPQEPCCTVWQADRCVSSKKKKKIIFNRDKGGGGVHGGRRVGG